MKSAKKNTNEGFSLVEVMIAAGILALAMVGIMQASTSGSSSGKTNTLDLDFTILMSNLQTVLNTDCTNLLQNKQLLVQATPNPSVGPLLVSSPSGYVVAAIPSPAPSSGLVITSISFNQLPVKIGTNATNTEYKTNLNVQAMKLGLSGKPLPGAPILHKDFPITAWVNQSSNLIVSCEPRSVPVGAVLTLSSGCVGPTAQVSASWTCANMSLVASAELLPADGTPPIPFPASATSTSFQVAPGSSNTYTLLLTDVNGMQSYGVASPTPSTIVAPTTCP